MDIYQECQELENENYEIRLVDHKDAVDLFEVYGDKFALPYFNSDNCNGSNFYCTKLEDVENTIKYWLMEYYETKGFVRFSIIDKIRSKVIGTIEMFRRISEDGWKDCGILRLDLRSDCEQADIIYGILSLIFPSFYEWFNCKQIITKAPGYAVERIEALKRFGFEKSETPLIGHHMNRAYYDYWVKRQ